MKKPLFFYEVFVLITILLLSQYNIVAQHSVKITLQFIPQEHKEDSIFVAGNFNEWNPRHKAYAFKKEGNRLSLTIKNLAADVYEFKFTRGGWDKVACNKSGGDISNYLLQLSSDTTVVYNVDAWKDDFVTEEKQHTTSPNVSVIDTAFFIPQLNRHRRIWLYLPPSYTRSEKKYPVLYMHDGQNIFDNYTSGYGEWGVDECLDSIMEKGKNECIVVGIDNGPKRLNEYNPFDNENFGKGEGKEYADFLVNTLKPFIDGHYRTLKDRNNTMIAGSSMGGLISCYMQLIYPDVFGKAGVFSPAFWTAPGISSMTDSLAKNTNGKFFFYMGGLEGGAYLNDMYDVMQKLGTNSSALIYSVTDPEGRHNETAWRKWFPEFFRFIMVDWTNYIIKITEN